MARTTLAALISEVRGIISDPTGSGITPRFTDDQIQAALDRSRLVVSYQPLAPLDPSWTRFGAPPGLGNWEGGYQIVTDWAVPPTAAPTPADANLTDGIWTWADPVYPNLFLIGSSHDPYGAAVSLLSHLLGAYRNQYDVSGDGGTKAYRQQQIGNIQAQIAALRPLMRRRPVQWGRGDLR